MGQRQWFILTLIIFFLIAVGSATIFLIKGLRLDSGKKKKDIKIKASPSIVTRRCGDKFKYYLDIIDSGNKKLWIIKNKIFPRKRTFTVTTEVEGPAGGKYTAIPWKISPHHKISLNKKRHTFYVQIPQNIPTGLYRIKNKVIAKDLYKEVSLLVEVVKPTNSYSVEKTYTPPDLTEKSCSPCYWGEKKRIRFADYTGESENSVSFYAVWDEENLYLAATVYDKDIFCNFSSKSIISSDHLQIFLNFNQQAVGTTHFLEKKGLAAGKILQLLFSPCGLYQIAKIHQKKRLNYALNLRWTKKVEGTINNLKDQDMGYWIVVALPWKELKIKPHPKMEIGINVINTDRSTKNPSKHHLISWAEDIKSLKEIYNYSLRKKIILEGGKL